MSEQEKELAELVGEMRALYAEMHAPPPVRYKWLSRWVKDLETDPSVQATVHKWASVWWLINFPIVSVLFFGFPNAWVYVGLLMNTFYSLYANFATDYGSLSAAQASLHAKEATQAVVNKKNNPSKE